MNKLFIMLAAVSLSTVSLVGEAQITNRLEESENRAVERCEPQHEHQFDSTADVSGTMHRDRQMAAKTQKAKQEPTSAGAPKNSKKAPLMLSFTEMNWVDLSERKGMQFALLSGDPKKGAYTQMRKVPAGTDNPLHAHSSELKNVIISGVWYTGLDAASARDFGAGSIVMMPANWEHVSGCRPGSDCVFYQEGKGKFDFKAIAPKASDAKPSSK